MRKRILMAMSGGVDSSTAAALLKERGDEVIGVGLKLAGGDASEEGERGCCGFGAMEDARRVALHLDIPFHLLNYERVFRQCVIDPFCRSYLAGRTPNPCVVCNERVKFGHLMGLADAVEADHIATGHYARVCRDDFTGRFLLKKGVDPDKDQSYFLHSLSQQQLARALFPLGGHLKDDTRELARSFGLPVCDKPASQDICFVGEGDYRRFLAEQCPGCFEPGPIVSTDGEVLGEHRGVAGYTVGQRKGLGVAAGRALFVVRIDPAARTVVVGRREELDRKSVPVSQVNWIAFDTPPQRVRAKVKTRYRQPGAAATVLPRGDGAAEIVFDAPVTAVAPGQSAVFYDGDLVIGGGTIE